MLWHHEHPPCLRHCKLKDIKNDDCVNSGPEHMKMFATNKAVNDCFMEAAIKHIPQALLPQTQKGTIIYLTIL